MEASDIILIKGKKECENKGDYYEKQLHEGKCDIKDSCKYRDVKRETKLR